MNVLVRYFSIAGAVVLVLHYLLRFSSASYGRATANASYLSSGRANATIVMLARNSELDQVELSVRRLEQRFNNKYNYPWVFLNDEPFTEEFKKRIRPIPASGASFGQVPHEHFFQPDWIDEGRAAAGRNAMSGKHIPYSGSVPYRDMCRFNSGFFFRHELLQKYKWYWRVEPGVHYHCDIDFDPFKYMEKHKKTYGFTIALVEFRETVESLWDVTKNFIARHPQYVAKNNAMEFLSGDNGTTWNLCHFWSNFEIADMDFWRGEAYTAYFDFLESMGGFYYERWGDAPVHSIAAALFLPRDQLHFFDSIAYEHKPLTHCPQSPADLARRRCNCDPTDSHDDKEGSCMPIWRSIASKD